VELALLSGGVALNDVAVRAKDAAPDAEPLIGWKRFVVVLRWLPLFRKTIRLATVEPVEPQGALDRVQAGELNLMAAAPASQAKAEPESKPESKPAPEGQPAAQPAAQPSGWKFGVDYVGLHRGGVRFRDFFVPDAEPVNLALQSIEVRDVAI